MQESAASEKLSATESYPTEASINVLADTSSNVQTSYSKCKKRETDNVIEQKKRDSPDEELECPQKRVCLVNADDICSVTDKDGGLRDTVAVEQLIHLMQQAKSSIQRSMLSGILGGTSREDCLHHFVQLGGVTILDEWLQDSHRAAKSGDGKDGDRAMEEVMLAILQALENLPVYLETLKGCSVGKSVNQLRSLKNGEIQKKARKLVDIWKRRVEHEMKQNSPSSGTSDNSHKGDSMASSTVATPIKSEDESNKLTTPRGESFSSTPVNRSASQNTTLAKTSEKASSSFEKDRNKNNVYSCSSTTSVSAPSLDGENEDNNVTVGTQLVFANDTSTQSEAQNYDGKGARSGANLNKHNLNGSMPSPVPSNAKERTNEYRKKLRSSSYRTPPNAGSSHEAPSRNDTDIKTTDLKEKNEIEDVETSSHLEQLTNMTNNPVDLENVRQTPSSTTRPDGSGEDKVAQKDGGLESITDAPLSSSSSYADEKIAMLSNGVTMGDGEKEKGNNENSKEIHQEADIVQEKVDLSSDSKQILSYCNSRKEIKCDMSDICVLKKENSPTQKSKTMEALAVQPDAIRQIISSVHCGHQVGAVTSASTTDAGCLHKATYSKESSHPLPMKRNEIKIRVDETENSSNEPCQPSYDHAGNILRPNRMLAAIKSDGVSNSCHDFDLNEGFKESLDSVVTADISRSTCSLPVFTTANRALVPASYPMINGGEGLKAYADTSGFGIASSSKWVPSAENQTSANQVRNVKDFDLNIADHESEDCQTITSGNRSQSELDLNCPGDYMETDIPESATPVQVSSVKVQKTSAKLILGFDLNEGPNLDEMYQQQDLPTTNCSTSSASLSRSNVLFGDTPLWTSPAPTFSLPTPNISGRLEAAAGMRTVNQHNVNSLHGSSAIIPPPLPSLVYPHMTPFFGCTPMQFPSTFSYNPLPQALDPSIMDSKYGVVLQPSQAAMSATTNLRAPFMIDPPSGNNYSNSFYTWEKQDKNIYNNTDSGMVNYNSMSVREQLVNLESRAVPLEGQMRFFQQAPVSVPSSKRKDSDYAGLRWSMGH